MLVCILLIHVPVVFLFSDHLVTCDSLVDSYTPTHTCPLSKYVHDQTSRGDDGGLNALLEKLQSEASEEGLGIVETVAGKTRQSSMPLMNWF